MRLLVPLRGENKQRTIKMHPMSAADLFWGRERGKEGRRKKNSTMSVV